ncbi:hypothetical protein H4I96_10207 [Botrytis cinerea]
MCFFDQCQFVCGDYKWATFDNIVPKNTSHEKCKICTKIETKWGRIQKEQERVLRWKKENGKSRQHSIEASEEKIRDLQQEVNNLEWQRSQNAMEL